MATKFITSTLHNITPIPPGAIYRGSGMFEFETEKDPYNIKLKLAEYDPEKKHITKTSLSKLIFLPMLSFLKKRKLTR